MAICIKLTFFMRVLDYDFILYFCPEYHRSDNVSCVLQAPDIHLSLYT